MDQDQLNTQSRREEGINPEGRNSLNKFAPIQLASRVVERRGR
jgi:hypothetical protein